MKKLKVTKELWSLVKASKGRAKNSQVSALLGISKRTIGYIHESDSYEEYLEGIRERSRKSRAQRKLVQPSLALDVEQDESGKSYIKFYGDTVMLSRLASIAGILGVSEYEWSIGG